ncbi:TonB-dependent receptor [Olleya sp. AH-315-F22]|nr:TonB-dependent receptor [Olleya sp. AH-315-F22]
MRTITKIILLFCCAFSYAQTTVNGNVTDDNGQPLPGANVIVVGTTTGAVTDFNGNYTLTVDQAPPFSVRVSSIGFETATKEVTTNPQTLDFVLNEGNELDEIVISASRTPESVRESPVTIERFDAQDIQFAASPNFYTSLENLKGVDVNQGSLTFNSVNTRGFATFANTRFVQLVDGMDNASPLLNFVIGNMLGLNELDIASVELLPGASSALYGANAFNGILFMNSKSPWDDQGVSVYYKTGLTVQDLAGDNQFYDFGIRAAHAFSDKFAAKGSFSYLSGSDWQVGDYNQYVQGAPGTADTIIPFGSSPGHDALHIYGDEVATVLDWDAITGAPVGTFGSSLVGRTGYRESDLTDYKAKSGKADFSLNYKPFGNDIEIVWRSKIGFGNTIYQGANRYQLKNFRIQQHKLEVRGDNFFVRGYSTAEVAGDSYDMRFTGINMNKVGATQWFGLYAANYLGGIFGGLTPDQAHAGARVAADVLTPQPGTPEFKTLFNQITSDPDIATGSKFLDNTKMYVGEGNYNFKSLLDDAMDLQVGGSWRQYSLDSGGTIFTDYDGPINYNEYGAYVQAIKKFADDRLKLSASLRYDKNELIGNGSVSPRISLNYSAGENKKHNIRASFQTGFRNPDTQSLFIGFNVGRAILVGSAEANLDRRLPGTTLTGRDAYNDSYTLSSLFAFAASGDPSLLSPVQTALVEQEKVTAFDVGYRGKVGAITVDFNAYYNTYEGFIANKTVVTPISGSTADMSGVIDIATGNFNVFQLYTNSLADVNSYGAVIGLSTKIAKDYKLGINYTYAKFKFDQASDPDFKAGFNTPEHKVKVSFGNPRLFKNFGFGINGRWSDEYLWESSIANAVVDSRFVVDAQINYSVPSIKSIFKAGATNLGGEEYQSAVGAPFIGSQYFISWTINN